MNRREFISSVAATAAVSAAPRAFAAKPEDIRAVYVRLGRNIGYGLSKPLNFNAEFWNKNLDSAVKRNMNMALIDVCEGIQYESFPEVAAKGAKSLDWMRAEVKRLKKMGLEPIPKLNFSAAHDGWLGWYQYCRCTPKYYRVCAALIKEVCEVFDHPRFFHIGMDEEDQNHMGKREIVCYRRGEQWWKDFLFLVGEVEKNGARPWMWSDYGWNHGEEFIKRCPKSVLHSNWYYDELMDGFDLEKMDKKKWSYPAVKLFLDLDKAGFDQVPCGSVWVSPQRKNAGVTVNDSMRDLVVFCRKNLSPALLKGFLVAAWVNYDSPGGLKLHEHAMDLCNEGLAASL